MSQQGSNSELFAHENDALTARPQLHVFTVTLHQGMVCKWIHEKTEVKGEIARKVVS